MGKKNIHILRFFERLNLTIAALVFIMKKAFRGVAKLGIALGSGPRGPGFESRHSDHVECS